jgi:ABC-type multidrug transport system ATPase subunit
MSRENLRNPTGDVFERRQEKLLRKKEVVLQILGMAHRRDTILGNAMLRGVSGGEKKRVTIGVEMMNDSQLIIMDEVCVP